MPSCRCQKPNSPATCQQSEPFMGMLQQLASQPTSGTPFIAAFFYLLMSPLTDAPAVSCFTSSINLRIVNSPFATALQQGTGCCVPRTIPVRSAAAASPHNAAGPPLATCEAFKSPRGPLAQWPSWVCKRRWPCRLPLITGNILQLL